MGNNLNKTVSLLVVSENGDFVFSEHQLIFDFNNQVNQQDLSDIKEASFKCIYKGDAKEYS